jgi:hypothetical protein
MRNCLSVLLIVCGVLVGIALRESSVDAQADWLPFITGESLVLVMEPGRRQVRCTVTQSDKNFLGCKGNDELGRRAESWYNLRFVEESKAGPIAANSRLRPRRDTSLHRAGGCGATW